MSSIDQRRADRDRKRARLYPEFAARVESIQTRRQLGEFLNQSPQPDTPGRIHFTNLLHFLRERTRPGEATDSEWLLYESLARRLVANGDWPETVLKAFQ